MSFGSGTARWSSSAATARSLCPIDLCVTQGSRGKAYFTMLCGEKIYEGQILDIQEVEPLTSALKAKPEGADAMAAAEQATNCIKMAKTLKTAGTLAGLVIAAAPADIIAIATMATGERIST